MPSRRQQSNKDNVLPRAPIPSSVRDEVVNRCRRRCCMCYGLNGTLEIKDGQIAHLDRDRSNAVIDNLAYLCQECHTTYDKESNSVLSYTAGELRQYRDLLYAALGRDRIRWQITLIAHRSRYNQAKQAVIRAHEILRDFSDDVSLREDPEG
jgi:hypothetical protein